MKLMSYWWRETKQRKLYSILEGDKYNGRIQSEKYNWGMKAGLMMQSEKVTFEQRYIGGEV